MQATDVSNRGVARKLRFDPNYFFVGARRAGDRCSASTPGHHRTTFHTGDRIYPLSGKK
jgi:hypothetical protein